MGNEEKTIDDIFQRFLQVLAGASQIAIDRKADSGVIDFTETIQRAKQDILNFILNHEDRPKDKGKPGDCIPVYKLDSNEARGYINGYNSYNKQETQFLKKIFGEER